MTILECERCMILHSELPLQFLGYVVDMVSYLIKKGPSSSFDGGIPSEAWTSKKLKYLFSKYFWL